METHWKEALLSEFDKNYMKNLKSFLVGEIEKKKVIFPRGSQFFAAFNETPWDRVKVVILGQDPYHGPRAGPWTMFFRQTGCGYSSLPSQHLQRVGVRCGLYPPQHGYLLNWAHNGVLLLNATLSVEAGHAGSHQGKGWEEFTDQAIAVLNEKRENLVFMLWGSYARQKGQFINRRKHLVLTAPHPSPLSAHRGFLGCRHFSQANAYLERNGLSPIDWSLPAEVSEEAE